MRKIELKLLRGENPYSLIYVWVGQIFFFVTLIEKSA